MILRVGAVLMRVALRSKGSSLDAGRVGLWPGDLRELRLRYGSKVLFFSRSPLSFKLGTLWQCQLLSTVTVPLIYGSFFPTFLDKVQFIESKQHRRVRPLF
jgi:hypothetical protein